MQERIESEARTLREIETPAAPGHRLGFGRKISLADTSRRIEPHGHAGLTLGKGIAESRQIHFIEFAEESLRQSPLGHQKRF